MTRAPAIAAGFRNATRNVDRRDGRSSVPVHETQCRDPDDDGANDDGFANVARHQPGCPAKRKTQSSGAQQAGDQRHVRTKELPRP